ncbi:hypothetical protein BJV77DRAFT_97974 [Russula vinacea]|nr:hypothetical protein BJV77DRAFT_97974 [Russula vinacea]
MSRLPSHFQRGRCLHNASHDDQRGIGKFGLYVNVNCETLDWQIDSATQVCGALGNVLSAVEDLTIDIDMDVMRSFWENDTLDSTLWHELLLPFIGVKKLHISFSLTLELSQALESAPEELVLELLPELQELEVQLEIDSARKAFCAFVEARESAGRPIYLSASPIPQYLNQAMQLISGYQTFIHAQEKTISSYDELRSISRIIDNALKSATTDGPMKTSEEADEKFKKAIDALSGYEKKYHANATVARRLAEAGRKIGPGDFEGLKEKLSPSVDERKMMIEFLSTRPLLTAVLPLQN